MSKKQIISLEEAFEKGIVKIGDYIDYRPVYGKYRPTKEYTGIFARENPYFETEIFGWKLDNFNGNLILVADSVTSQELRLYGKIGYDFGPEALAKIASACYTDPMLAEVVGSINNKVYLILAPCNIQKSLPLYYHEDTCYGSKEEHGEALFYGIKYGNIYNGKQSIAILHEANGNDYYAEFHIRPIVYLRNDIDLLLSGESNGTKAKPWKPLRGEPQPDSDTTKENKEEAKPMSEENSHTQSEEKPLKQLLQEAEENLQKVDKLLKTVREILDNDML